MKEQEDYNEIFLEWQKAEIAMQEDINRHNTRLLKWLTKILGKKFVSDINDCLKETESIGKLFIERSPRGEYQDEEYPNKKIKGVWVDQWTSGGCEDCYTGYVSIQLDKKRFLITRYEM